VRRLLMPIVALAVLPAALASAASGPAGRPTVTVGQNGNEPLVRSAPDGTLYISALQHLYVSRDGGASWKQSPGSVLSQQANLASDSSIAIDKRGRLYQTFDYPYAGNTAVCTSDDRAETFSCNPAVLPGGTDRMWIALKDDATSYLVTNELLYQTVFATSTDRGATYVPGQTGTPLADPTDGPLLVSPTTGAVVQPIIDNVTNQTATTNFESGPGLLRVYDPTATVGAATTRPIPVLAGGALPGAAYGKDGTLYVTSERATRVKGRIVHVGVQVVRSRDDGRTWTALPIIPGTTSGTSTFVAVGAGAAGHVGLVFYRSAVAGDPGALPAAASWDVVYAETHDALAAVPTWDLRVVDRKVHRGVICATAGCLASGRFAGDFIDTSFDSADHPLIAWVRETGEGQSQLRFAGAQGGSVPVVAPRKPVLPPISHPPGGALAATGAAGGVAALALGLLGVGAVLRRRTRS
jgi:hypothetical protein